MSITERARGDRAFADIGDWADKELISDVTNKVRAYKRDDVAKKRAGITVTPAEAIEFLKTFAPTRCWGCGVPLTWPGVYSTISGEKRCLRQYSFDRIDDSRAHEASNLIVTCLGCNVLHRLGSGPVACPRGCHSGWPYRAQPITSAAHAKLVKFHQNPEPELSLARSLVDALYSDLYPDSEWADLEDADAVVKTFGISANRPCAPLFRSLKFAGNAIELAFAARHNCLGNLLAAELEGYGFAPPRSGCWGCKEEGEPLGTCRACGVAKYCKKACQVSHWRAGHKTECTDWRNLKERHLPTGERAKPTSAEDLHSFDDANSRVSHYERWLAAKCEEAGDEKAPLLGDGVAGEEAGGEDPPLIGNGVACTVCGIPPEVYPTLESRDEHQNISGVCPICWILIMMPPDAHPDEIAEGSRHLALYNLRFGRGWLEWLPHGDDATELPVRRFECQKCHKELTAQKRHSHPCLP